MQIDRRNFLFGGMAVAALGAAALTLRPVGASTAAEGTFEISLTQAEWREKLPADVFNILREEGTEYPGTSALLNEHRPGTYACAGCDLPLFDAATKYDSRTGWPSFYAPLENAVGEAVDYKLGYARREVHCRRCGGHLGHVFEDGPQPTGLRYCMNGLAMTFTPSAA